MVGTAMAVKGVKGAFMLKLVKHDAMNVVLGMRIYGPM
jgi:hypothetical protein